MLPGQRVVVEFSFYYSKYFQNKFRTVGASGLEWEGRTTLRRDEQIVDRLLARERCGENSWSLPNEQQKGEGQPSVIEAGGDCCRQC